jgi:hypothetical protein
MALAVVGVFVFGKSPMGLSALPTTVSTSLVATVVFNQPGLASYYAAARHTAHNAWPTASFEWTNAGHSSTTPAPFLRAKDLMP